MSGKPLDNTTVEQAAAQTSDLKIFGDGNAWKLICKASSAEGGWMKSTKAMDLGGSLLVQVTTEFHKKEIPWSETEDGKQLMCAEIKSPEVSESLVHVPMAWIEEHKDAEGNITGRSIRTQDFNKVFEILLPFVVDFSQKNNLQTQKEDPIQAEIQKQWLNHNISWESWKDKIPAAKLFRMAGLSAEEHTAEDIQKKSALNLLKIAYLRDVLIDQELEPERINAITTEDLKKFVQNNYIG